jgi:hypothetical protein
MLRSDTDYFRQRAAAEREMAQHAASPDIAAIHEQLAREYDSLAGKPEARGVLHAA